MKKKSYWLMIGLMALLPMTAMAQQNGLTDTRNSKYAVMTDTPIDAVRWTGGFWGERFNVFAGTSVKNMWKTWQTEEGKGLSAAGTASVHSVL